MRAFLSDIRFAIRTLLRSPGFAAVAVLTLALGIGASTGIFSLVNGLLLRSLPVDRPSELVWVGLDVSAGRWSNTHSYRLYEVLRDSDAPFRGFAASSFANVGLSHRESTQMVTLSLVTGEYFPLLGVGAAAGRVLSAADDRRDAPGALVLAHNVWRDRFGSDAAIVGSRVQLAGEPFVVVGVAAAGFYGNSNNPRVDGWAPMAKVPVLALHPSFRDSEKWKDAGSRFLQILARMPPDVSPELARAAAEVAYRAYVEEYFAPLKDVSPAMRERYANHAVALRPMRALSPQSHETYSNLLALLGGAVGLLLLITCSNVANLLLARGLNRRQELAIRAASGASRIRLARQLLAEALVLSVALQARLVSSCRGISHRFCE